MTDFMKSRNMEEDLAFGSGCTALGCIDPIYIQIQYKPHTVAADKLLSLKCVIESNF